MIYDALITPGFLYSYRSARNSISPNHVTSDCAYSYNQNYANGNSNSVNPHGWQSDGYNEEKLQDMEAEISSALRYPFKEKHLGIKKPTGLGVTEFFLRFMAWLALKDMLTGIRRCASSQAPT